MRSSPVVAEYVQRWLLVAGPWQDVRVTAGVTSLRFAVTHLPCMTLTSENAGSDACA